MIAILRVVSTPIPIATPTPMLMLMPIVNAYVDGNGEGKRGKGRGNGFASRREICYIPTLIYSSGGLAGSE